MTTVKANRVSKNPLNKICVNALQSSVFNEHLNEENWVGYELVILAPVRVLAGNVITYAQKTLKNSASVSSKLEIRVPNRPSTESEKRVLTLNTKIPISKLRR